MVRSAALAGVSIPSATISARAVPPWATATVSTVNSTVPIAHPCLHVDIALAARRRHRPFSALASGKQLGVQRLHLRQRRALPMTVADFAQPIVDGVFIAAADRRTPRTSSIVDRARPSGLATNCSDASSRRRAQTDRPEWPRLRGLLAAEIVERNILRALQPAFRIPLGFAVANVVDRRARASNLPAIPCSASC